MIQAPVAYQNTTPLANSSIKVAQATVTQDQAALNQALQNLGYCTIKAPVRGVIIDLTQRKQEAQALLESEERLKLALAAGNIGIWNVGIRDLVVRDIYNWCHTTLGYDFEPGVPLTVDKCKTLINPLDLPNIIYAFYRHIRGKAPLFESNFRVRKMDGVWIWVTVHGKVIERTADGEPLRITGTVNEMNCVAECNDPETRGKR